MTRPFPPPLLPALPLIGNLLEFAHDPIALFRRGHERFGEVFALRLGRKHVTVLVGPELHRLFFTLPGSVLSLREVYDWVAPMFGDKFPMVAREADHAALRPVLGRAFSASQHAFYAAAAAREIDAWAAGLRDDARIEAVETLGRLAVACATRAFLGDDFRRRRGDAVWPLVRDVALGMELVLPRSLPLPRFRARDRAAAALRALVADEIRERRRSSTRRGNAADESPPERDLLAHLIEAVDGGDPRGGAATLLTARDAAELAGGMVWVGHETMMGHASWALVQLLKSPSHLAVVTREAREVLAAGRAPQAAVERLPHLERALRETERMYPPVTCIARYNAAAYEVRGRRVEAGGLTMVVPPVAHRLAHVFRDPDVYDPDRFATPRNEDRRGSFALIGFGAGARVCLGRSFAYSFMTLALGRLLADFEIELLDPDPRPRPGPDPSRPVAVPLLIRRRAGAALGGLASHVGPSTPSFTR